jgi:hypothetical protein
LIVASADDKGLRKRQAEDRRRLFLKFARTRNALDVRQSIFSIDVEDWFNLSGTGQEPPPSQWDHLESRLEKNFRGLLELLAQRGAISTCFFLGYFAKRFPHLVREAAAAGHEIASHSYFHRLAYEMSPAEFYDDALASRQLLEDISGAPVRGYRAPAFSVTAVVLRTARSGGLRV